MAADEEEKLLRSVALQNANSILLARQRAEQDLIQAKEALELRTKELAHSLAMMRATLESTTDGILVTDSDGNVMSFNRKFVELWRLPPAALEVKDHRGLLDFIANQVVEPARFIARIEEIYATAPPECFDHLDLADGRIVERFSRIQSIDGRIIGRVWSLRDVTESRRAMEARLRLSAIVESSVDAIISKNLDGVIVSWNKAAERLYGYTAAEVVGKPLSILIPPDHPDELPAIMERLKRGEQIEHLETKRLRKDGRKVDVSLTISPVQSSDGRIIGASKIARDITGRKQAERTTRFLADASAILAELTDYNSTLQKVASLAVPQFADWCAVDIQEADGTMRQLAFTHLDPAKAQLIRELDRKYPSRGSEMVGVTKVLRTGEPEWAAEMPDEMLAAMAHDEEHLRIIRELGVKSYICVPLKSRSKSFGTLTFATTESHRAYNADDLQAANDLAHRAVIAIENANLLAALKESDRRKDEFLAMLAHELRNPLAPIRNSVQLLRAKSPHLPEVQWATEVIDRQVHQMTRLVDDLLDVSRITRGKIELRRERVELAAVVASAIEASRPLIEKRRHELTVAIPPEPIVLNADLTRVAQILSNLLNNAAKYTDEGGRIALTAQREDEMVAIRVTDNGVGMSTEMLPRIFDMFAQEDRSLERAQGGLGIGLTLVRRLVELHGGTAEAHSDGPGMGSLFLVRLPIASDIERGGMHAVAGGGDDLVAPRKCRILVVDDNRDAADSLGKLLRTIGHDVQTAYDGLDAVERAATFEPDVILMDIGLPKVNGYDAARRIREQAAGDKIILIALTGWGQEEDRRRSSAAGFDHHMTKPVEFDALQKLLPRG